MSKAIPVGAAVRSNVSRRLGRVLPPPSHLVRGKLYVWFDGMEQAVAIDTTAVSYVAQHYETAKSWEADHA